MQHLITSDAIHYAANHHPSVSLRQLLFERIEHLSQVDSDLASLFYVVIYQPNDSLSELNNALGFDIQTKPYEFNDDYGDWCEITYVLSDDGYGCLLYIEKSNSNPKVIQRLCAQATVPYMN